jgi:hypothetical protein
MKNKIALLSVFLLLVSCSDSNNTGSAIKGSTDRTGKEITITVNFVETEGELKRLYSNLTGVPNSSVPDQYGFAQWNEMADGSDPQSLNCQIYALPPKRIDDSQILTLGHELAHCIWGSYHN